MFSPSDVVALAAGSSVVCCTDEGFHTARHVSLAVVFTSPRSVGVSSSCWTSVLTPLDNQQKQQTYLWILVTEGFTESDILLLI